MNLSQIDAFFEALSSEINIPVQIYLTGGVAGWLMGGQRPTQDLDFALKAESHWDSISKAIQQLSVKLKLPVEFSEDISRWGMIGFPNFTLQASLC